MAESETQICNLALSLFGNDRINDLTDDNETANLCNLWYPQTRDEVMSEPNVEWKFAIARKRLTAAATPDFGWDYQYALPAGLLKLIAVVYEEIDLPDSRWLREGDNILTNETNCYVRYTQRIENVTKFPALFTAALYTLLGSVLAAKIAHNLPKSLELLQKYELMLSRAKMTNAEETYVKDKDGQQLFADSGRYR